MAAEAHIIQARPLLSRPLPCSPASGWCRTRWLWAAWRWRVNPCSSVRYACNSERSKLVGTAGMAGSWPHSATHGRLHADLPRPRLLCLLLCLPLHLCSLFSLQALRGRVCWSSSGMERRRWHTWASSSPTSPCLQHPGACTGALLVLHTSPAPGDPAALLAERLLLLCCLLPVAAKTLRGGFTGGCSEAMLPGPN